LSIQSLDEFGWYCRTLAKSFTLEGKKTAAFEIWERWLELIANGIKKINSLTTMRLSRFCLGGDGNIISGIHKGLKDLSPSVIPPAAHHRVQAEGSAAIANAFNANTETITPVSAKTIADSISVTCLVTESALCVR